MTYKLLLRFVLTLGVYGNIFTAISQPPRDPLVISPQVNADKKVNVNSYIVPGRHTWMNCKQYLATTLQEIFK